MAGAGGLFLKAVKRPAWIRTRSRVVALQEKPLAYWGCRRLSLVYRDRGLDGHLADLEQARRAAA